jgi:ABC-2 type transport system ATP-binding protein
VFGLLGPNGAGKTTLLRLLLGFLRPTSGSATIDTLDCYRQSLLVRTRVSYLPGEARLFRGMRGHDVLRFFSYVRAGDAGGGSVELRRSLRIAERFGLELDRPVVQMSTGMRQKLALAVAMAPDVPLVILDEPTSSLDPTMRSEVLQLVAGVKAEGRTVFFSSHVLSEVEEVCDRVAIMRQGRLVHTQVMSELRRQHRISAQLLGPLPPLPAELQAAIRLRPVADGQVIIETASELAPLLGWLSTLPLAEVRIEPIGLQTVFGRYHQSNGV